MRGVCVVFCTVTGLFQREIAWEYAALGMTPPNQYGPPRLKFKEGGVLPAGSTGARPKSAP